MKDLHEIHLHKLHPTQITVGTIEVRDKYREIAGMRDHHLREYLQAHAMPAVRANEDKWYVTDRHHLARALWEAGIEHVFITIEGELTNLTSAMFWREMTRLHWAHPIDERGVRRSAREIPKHFRSLRDDVYRSLAGYVRAAGGFRKTATAFAEFEWANWFRSRVIVGPTREEFLRAVDTALKLASSPEAAHLPGFSGGEPPAV